MDDPLIVAAKRLGVPTHRAAGPGYGPGNRSIWASLPRSRLEIAQDALDEVVELDRTAGIVPAGHSHLWRAFAAGWTYEGEFVDAVASLALHVISGEGSHSSSHSSSPSSRAAHS